MVGVIYGPSLQWHHPESQLDFLSVFLLWNAWGQAVAKSYFLWEKQLLGKLHVIEHPSSGEKKQKRTKYFGAELGKSRAWQVSRVWKCLSWADKNCLNRLGHWLYFWVYSRCVLWNSRQWALISPLSSSETEKNAAFSEGFWTYVQLFSREAPSFPLG